MALKEQLESFKGGAAPEIKRTDEDLKNAALMEGLNQFINLMGSILSEDGVKDLKKSLKKVFAKDLPTYKDSAKSVLTASIDSNGLEEKELSLDQYGRVVNKYGLVMKETDQDQYGRVFIVDSKINCPEILEWAHLTALQEKIEQARDIAMKDPNAFSSVSNVKKFFYANEENDGTIKTLSNQDCEYLKTDIIRAIRDKEEEIMQERRKEASKRNRKFNRKKAMRYAAQLLQHSDFNSFKQNMYSLLTMACDMKKQANGTHWGQHCFTLVSSRGGTGKSTLLKVITKGYNEYYNCLNEDDLMSAEGNPYDFLTAATHLTDIYTKKGLVTFDECTDVRNLNSTACNPIIDGGFYQWKKLYKDPELLKSNCITVCATNKNFYNNTENNRRCVSIYFTERWAAPITKICQTNPGYYEDFVNEQAHIFAKLIAIAPDNMSEIADIEPSEEEARLVESKIAADLEAFLTYSERGQSLLGGTSSIGIMCRLMRKDGYNAAEEQLAIYLYDHRDMFFENFHKKDGHTKGDGVYSRFTLKKVIDFEHFKQAKEEIFFESFEENINAWLEKAKEWED